MGPEEDPPQESGPSGEDTGSPGGKAGRGPSPPEERAEDHPGVSASPQPSEEAGDQPSQPASGGSVRFQDPATTRPRPPTVGETRAREKAERKRQELEKARVEAELKRYQRNQRLKGGAAVVGVVGVVAALGYWALSPRTVNAQCVQEDASGGPIIVPDNYCTGHGGGIGRHGAGGKIVGAIEDQIVALVEGDGERVQIARIVRTVARAKNVGANRGEEIIR